eukprot:COSAG04_NODE_7785_length_1067_cov_8.036157_1_plen_64_part_10
MNISNFDKSLAAPQPGHPIHGGSPAHARRRWPRPGACKAEGMSHAENIHSAIPAVHRLMSSPAV